MGADTTVDELIDSVADGDAIDWAALEANADPEILHLLALVKTVSGVADVHRTPVDGDETGPVSVHEADRAVHLGEVGHWGHLQLVRKVGEGSYGEVYHARDTWLDHPVALKLLRPDLTDRVSPNKLLQEARVLVKVRHPNVVAVHGADLHQNRVGFWMEFVQGQRLDDLVAFQGLLSAEEAAAIGLELCSALAAVHDAGLVHRDVKAQNVIREPKGRVVLMDFGAGQFIADTVGGHGAGTPLYLAPEMFESAPASAQTDVYALGVLLYYLVTAGYPVPARSIDELKEAHARGRQRPLLVARPGLPRGFVNVVEKMLAPDPAERYQTASEALAGLKRFVAPMSFARRAILLGVWTAAALGVTTFYGLLATVSFNLLLGRPSAFHDEWTLSTWLRWGLSSLLAPVVYIGVALLGLSVLTSAFRAVRRLFTSLDTGISHLQRRIVNLAAQGGLDNPNTVLSLAVAIGAIVLAGIFWSFREYGAGFVSSAVFINDAPPERLATMRPSNELHADTYGWMLDLLLLAYGLAIRRIVRWGDRVNARFGRTAIASLVIVPAFALLFWEAPYRLVYHSAFERVDLGPMRCYRLGDNRASVLLHCPDVAPPRNRVVAIDDPQLKDRGVMESIFAASGTLHTLD